MYVIMVIYYLMSKNNTCFNILMLFFSSVLKVGVSCLNDARKLMRDHAILVLGCVDLRHTAGRCGRKDLE